MSTTRHSHDSEHNRNGDGDEWSESESEDVFCHDEPPLEKTWGLLPVLVPLYTVTLAIGLLCVAAFFVHCKNDEQEGTTVNRCGDDRRVAQTLLLSGVWMCSSVLLAARLYAVGSLSWSWRRTVGVVYVALCPLVVLGFASSTVRDEVQESVTTSLTTYELPDMTSASVIVAVRLTFVWSVVFTGLSVCGCVFVLVMWSLALPPSFKPWADPSSVDDEHECEELIEAHFMEKELPTQYVACGAALGMSDCPGRRKKSDWRNLFKDLRFLAEERGVTTIVTLLTLDDLGRVGVAHMRDAVESIGMDEWLNFSQRDKFIPRELRTYVRLIARVVYRLRQGKKVLVHCNGGRGRTGLFATCVLLALGLSVDEALRRVRGARERMIRNPLQLIYLRHFARVYVETYLHARDSASVSAQLCTEDFDRFWRVDLEQSGGESECVSASD